MLSDSTDTLSADRRAFGLAVAALLVFALALGLRLAHLFAMDIPENPLNRPTAFDMDTQRIHEQALRILKEGPFPATPFPHAPGFCYTVAAVYRVLGPEGYPFVYALNALMGSLTALVVLWLGRRLFGTATAFLGALLAAVYGPLLFHVAFMLGDVQGALLATVVLAQLVRLRERPGVGGALLLGALLGLAALTRPNAILLSVAITTVLFLDTTAGPLRRRFQLLCATGAVSALLIAHSTWTASRSTGHLELICPTMTFNFVWANSVTSTGYGSAYPPPGTPLHDTVSWPRLLHELRKASYIWRFFEFPCNTNYYLFSMFSPVVDLNPFTWRLVGPFALTGMLLAACERRAAPALWFILWCWIPLNLTFVLGRLRLVMMPVLMLFAADAAVWLAVRIAGRAPRTYLPHACVFLGASALFVNLQDPSYYHGVFYADFAFGNHERYLAQNEVEAARKANEAGKRADTMRLLESARMHMTMLRRLASATYQAVAWRGIGEICGIERDTAGYEAARLREKEIIDKMQRLPIVDHTGERFTPPTYRFWPYRWDPSPTSLAWMDRELAHPTLQYAPRK